jgi:predicted HicB family RNase H-like nuclease
MRYRGLTGIIEPDDQSEIVFGKVIGIRDIITFQGRSVAAAWDAFRDSVDSYLALCAARGEDPRDPEPRPEQRR